MARRCRGNDERTSTSSAGFTSGLRKSFLASSQGHSSGTRTPPCLTFLPSPSAAALVSSRSACLYEIHRQQCTVHKQKKITYFSRSISTTLSSVPYSRMYLSADLGPTPLIGSR